MRKLTVFASVVSLLFFASFAGADVIKLKLANYFPPTHMNSIMMGKYCEDLNKKLTGKVEITQYTGGTLLSATKMAAGVASGIADIGQLKYTYTIAGSFLFGRCHTNTVNMLYIDGHGSPISADWMNQVSCNPNSLLAGSPIAYTVGTNLTEFDNLDPNNYNP